jgi:hypothetical protein
MMKRITDMDRGAEQPSNQHQREKLIRDGAVHDTQGEVTRKPGFQKGHAKVGGRKKGGQNKITRDVKEAVLAAGEKHGSDGKGKDGLVGAFLHVLRKKPEAWCSVAGKLITNQHTISKDTDISYKALEEIEAEMRELGVVIMDYAK